MLHGPKPSPGQKDQFAIYWVEAGHRIREQISDDRVLVNLLRRLLPPYQGGNLKLYRGENLDRLTSNHIGFAWTSELCTAEMFARGLNAIKSGGVLLEGYFKSKAIISGPDAHSVYLGEKQFTIDPFISGEIVTLTKFPPI